MGGKTHNFNHPLYADADAGQNELTFGPVRVGRKYCVQRATAINETSAFTSLKVIVRDRPNDFVDSQQDSPQANIPYWTDKDIYLTEGQELVIQFNGCTANDVLRAWLRGWWQMMEEDDA